MLYVFASAWERGNYLAVSHGNETLGTWRLSRRLPRPPQHTHTTTMEEKNARQSYLSIPQPKLIVSGADQPQNHGVFIQDGSLERTQISDSQSVFSEALEFYRST